MGDSGADVLPDYRSLPVPEAIQWLAEHGEPADPRTDIDTVSLVRRFRHLASVTTTNAAVDGPHGTVDIRIYCDAEVDASGAVLVWVHGGAFIGGHLDMPEANWVALELASRGIPTVTVDYTKCLGSSHYPIPSDDVLAAWHHISARAQALFGVGADGLVIGGASAGSTLAAGAVARLRDDRESLPGGLVLVYPLLHPNGPAASADLDESHPLGQLALNYAGSRAALADTHVFPGLDDGHDFPETLIVVCEEDPLRPSGIVFARTLAAAAVPVELYQEDSAGHGHIDHPGDPAALRTIDRLERWLRGIRDDTGAQPVDGQNERGVT